jgi:hypothetical protein
VGAVSGQDRTRHRTDVPLPSPPVGQGDQALDLSTVLLEQVRVHLPELALLQPVGDPALQE